MKIRRKKLPVKGGVPKIKLPTAKTGRTVKAPRMSIKPVRPQSLIPRAGGGGGGRRRKDDLL